MKRTPLKRKTPLRSAPKLRTPSPLKRAERAVRELEPGEAEWKRRRSGTCAACGTYGRIVWHHVVDKNLLGRLGLPRYEDTRNAFPIGAPFIWGGRCRCHDEHENVGIEDKRIPYAKIPQPARDFAVEVLGEGPAYEYFRRNYR